MTSANEFFDAEHVAFDRQYERDPSFQERFAEWTALITSYGRSGTKVLDVGCGSGVFSCFAASRGMDVTGLDPAQRMLELAERRRSSERLTQARFIAGSLADVTALPGPWDLILCSSVLEYVDDLDGSVAILASALAPGGHLIISLPNAACLYRQVESVAHRLTGRPRYRGLIRTVATPTQVERLAVAHNLDVCETRYYARDHRLRVLNPMLSPARRSAMFVTVLRRRAGR